MDDIDGHPLYGWEQLLVLRAIFDKLDIERKGSIALAQLLTVNTNPATASLVQFTLFGAWCKLRQASLFNGLFKHYVEGAGCIDFKALSAGLSKISREISVHSQFVRLDAEHLQECAYTGPTRKTKLASHAIYRKAYLKRALKIGDIVWGLFAGGVRWFPAVIDDLFSDGTYSLVYPLSAKHVRLRTNKHTTFLRKSIAAVSSSGVIKPVGLSEERLLAHVFDLADSDSVGSIDSQQLLDTLKTRKYSEIVRSSLALATLAMDDHSALVMDGAQRTSLHQIVLHLYYSKAALNDGKVSKAEFVQIGLFAVDLVAYNVK